MAQLAVLDVVYRFTPFANDNKKDKERPPFLGPAQSSNAACSRCLQAYETQLATRFDLTYTRSISHDTETFDQHKEIELKAQDLGLIFFNGEEIDLMEGIQEQAVLAFPIQPLCQHRCKGLCSRCGADLNQGDCGCDRGSLNSQFAALKNLKLDNR